MIQKSLTTKEFILPFALITVLFFLWGIANGILDVLNKHFQEILQISKARSGLIQFAVIFHIPCQSDFWLPYLSLPIYFIMLLMGAGQLIIQKI
jgi:hypothetical protein